MERGDAYTAVLNLKYRNPDDALRRIADELRAETPDRLFLDMLAYAIHPDRKFPVSLVPARSGRGIPPEKPSQMGKYTLMRILVLGEKAEAAIAATEARFRVSRSTAAAGLARARQWAQKHPDLHADIVESLSFCVATVALHNGGRGAAIFEDIWSD